MKKKLKFWLMPNAGFESRKVIQQEIAHFQKLHPGIEVVCEILPWSRAWFKLLTAIKEKSGPDILQVGTSWIATLAYLGAIRRLENRNIVPGQFHHTLFDQCQCFGHLWSLPWFGEGRVLYYRADFFDAARLTPADISTWDGLTAACARIKHARGAKPSVAPFAFSSQKEHGLIQDISSWVWAAGGDFLSPHDKRPWMDSPETRAGITSFIDLIAARHITRQSLAQNAGEVTESFFQGNDYAVLMASSWPLQVYLNPASKQYIGAARARRIGIAIVPGGPAGRFNFAGGSALAVSNYTHHPSEAYQLLEFLTGKESQLRYCSGINMLAARNEVSVMLSPASEIQTVFEKSIISHGRSFPAHPLWGSIEQIIVSGLAQSIRDYVKSGCDRDMLFKNMSEINSEIEYILTIFGE